MPTNQGPILVSFLTLFVQFSGACFWRVLCFVLHQCRSTTAARDGLFHQQQTILRNAITAPSALYNIGCSALAWRGKVRAPFLHFLPLLIVTLVHIGCFAAAGLLSSQIASANAGEALVRSTACGYPREIANVRNTQSENLSEKDLDTFNAEVLLGRLTLTKSAAYVRSCYNDGTSSASTDCNIFVRSHIVGVNPSAVTNASCPFGSDACATPAVRYDSGSLHSNRDLGMNFPSTEGLSMRRVTTCAPILSDTYATGWRDNLPEAYGGMTNTSVKFYEFGKGDVGCEATPSNSTTNATTFCVSQYMKDYWRDAYTVMYVVCSWDSPSIDVERASTAYHKNTTASDFEPIPDFQVPHADVTLIALYIKTKYIGQIDDPLFNAKNASIENPDFATPTHDLNRTVPIL